MKKFLGSYIYALILILCSGCGNLLPGSSSKDESLAEQTQYHISSAACSSLDLSSANLSPQATRSLVNCLNSNGQIPAAQQLVNSVSDEELSPITQWLSNTLFINPDRMKAMHDSLLLLDRSGNLDPLLRSTGDVLDNEKFVFALLDITSDIFYSNQSIFNGNQIDSNLVTSIEYFAKNLNQQDIAAFLDTMATLMNSNALEDLNSKFQTSNGRPLSTDATLYAQTLFQILDQSRQEGRYESIKYALSLIASGELWPFLDHIIPENKTDLLSKIPLWSNLIENIYYNQGAFFNNSPFMMQALVDTSLQPITCMSRTTTLKALTPAKVFEQLNHSSLKSFLNSLAFSRPFCNFSDEILDGADALYPLALSAGSTILEDWTRELNRNPNLIAFLVGNLSDRERPTGIQFIIDFHPRLYTANPLIQNLSSRSALNDLLLILSRLQVTNRTRFQNIANNLLGQIHNLNQATSRISTQHLLSAILSLQSFIDHNDSVFKIFALKSRDAFFQTSDHPIVGITLETLQNLNQYQATVNALLSIRKNHPTEFLNAIREVASMAHSSQSTLKEILLSFFKLYNSRIGDTPIATNTPIPAVPNGNHNYRARDLTPSTPPQLADGAFDRCQEFDLRFSISDYHSSRFAEQFQDLASCIAPTSNEQSLVQSILFIADRNRGQGVLEGQSILGFTVETMQTLAHNSHAVAALVEKGLQALQDDRIRGLLQAFTQWSHAQIISPLLAILNRAETDSPRSSTALKNHRDGFLNRSATVCYIHVTQEQDDWGEIVEKRKLHCENLQLKDAIRNQLAIWEPNVDTERRTEELIEEFFNGKENDFLNLQEYQAHSGNIPNSISKSDFLNRIHNLYTWLFNVRNSEEDPQHLNQSKALEGLLNFTKSLNPDMNGFKRRQYSEAELKTTAVQLTHYMVQEANRLIVQPYYLIGDSRPRVRILSGLDVLSLVLMNADIVLPNQMEPGTLGLSLVPYGWLDESTDKYPSYIVSTGISDVFDLSRIVEILIQGVPEPEQCNSPRAHANDVLVCKNRILNLRGYSAPAASDGTIREQPSLTALFNIYLKESGFDPDSGVSPCGQSAYSCFGLKIVRNLFSAVWDSTPEPYRMIVDNNSGQFIAQKLNLKALRVFAETGVFRKATLLLQNQSADDADLIDFFHTAVILGNHSEFAKTITLAKNLIDGSEMTSWNSTGVQKGLAQKTFETLYDLSQNQIRSELAAYTAFHFIGAMTPSQLLSREFDTFTPLIRVMNGLSANADAKKILAGRIELLTTLLGSEFNSNLSQTLHHDSQSSQGEWQSLIQRLRQLRTNPQYPKEALDRTIESVISFLENPGAAETRDGALFRQISILALDQAKSGELEGLIRTIAHDRQQSQQLVESLSMLIRDSRVETMLGTIERLMNPPQSSAAAR